MKTIFTTQKRKLLRRVYGALSLTTALFVFQACYGTNKDFGADVRIEGFVKAKTTNLPIAGIKVSIDKQPQYEYTDNTGKFSIYASQSVEYKLRFEDIDFTSNGSFAAKDTVIKVVDHAAFLYISLDAK